MARRLVLTGAAAAGLAAVLQGSGRASPAALRCDTPGRVLPFTQEVILGYPPGPPAVVTVAATGCDLSVAVSGDRADELGAVASAGLFFYTSVTTGGSSPPAPDLIGLSAAQATAAARRHHFSVTVGGPVTDHAAVAGTVAFQSPPAGARARAAGREVEIMLAARAAPACRAAQLALSYLGGGVGAGTTWPRC